MASFIHIGFGWYLAIPQSVFHWRSYQFRLEKNCFQKKLKRSLARIALFTPRRVKFSGNVSILSDYAILCVARLLSFKAEAFPRWLAENKRRLFLAVGQASLPHCSTHLDFAS